MGLFMDAVLLPTSTEDLEEVIACSTEYKQRSLNLAVVELMGRISPGYWETSRREFRGSGFMSPSAEIMNDVKRESSSIAFICTEN